MRSYRDLDVWQRGMSVAEVCYRTTHAFARAKAFGLTSGLTSKIRRASATVQATIAEAYGRDGTASFIQFLRPAGCAPRELDTHLPLAQRAEISDATQGVKLLGECGITIKMLRNPIRSLRSMAASTGKCDLINSRPHGVS